MAYAEPYTFSNLQRYLKSIEKLTTKFYCSKEILCYTILGNPCYLLTITSPQSSNRKTPKQGIVLTARVHPGETVGSWMLQGVIEFLLSENKYAEMLRKNYVFKIVPMLNPDGVINGNYRCSFSGCDLNRRYCCPSKVLHPTIYYLRRMVKLFAKNYPLLFYCDFHGHSKSKNAFMYGNADDSNPVLYKIFPYIMSNINPHFLFSSSRFSVQRSKASTARIVMWKEFNICSVYTIEASFFGPDEKNEYKQLNIKS